MGRTLIPGDQVLMTGVAIDAQQRIVLLDAFNRSVVRFDPVTGELETISILSLVEREIIGSGVSFIFPIGLAIEADENLVVVDDFLDVVLRVDPDTGDRTPLSGLDMGAGPPFGRPLGVDIEADGGIVVADVFRESLLRIDPISGDRTAFKCLQ